MQESLHVSNNGYRTKALWVMALVLIAQFSARTFAAEPLLRAIESDDEKRAVELVKRGEADLEERNSVGETALHRAVEKGMQRLAQALLSAKADPNAPSKHGETALHLAALYTEPDYVDLLLAAGADPKA